VTTQVASWTAPRQAGAAPRATTTNPARLVVGKWIPAFAGMTATGFSPQSRT